MGLMACGADKRDGSSLHSFTIIFATLLAWQGLKKERDHFDSFNVCIQYHDRDHVSQRLPEESTMVELGILVRSFGTTPYHTLSTIGLRVSSLMDESGPQRSPDRVRSWAVRRARLSGLLDKNISLCRAKARDDMIWGRGGNDMVSF